jgi:hypothetical protein
MTNKPVVIELDCDLKVTRTFIVRSKLSATFNSLLRNQFPEKYRDYRDIGPFKYRFR